MEIRALDVDDDVEFAQYCRVYERAIRRQAPHARIDGDDEIRPFLRATEDTTALPLVAVEGGRVLGAALGFLRTADRERAMMNVFVDPPNRGRGIGTALADVLDTRVVAHGRTLGDVTVALAPGVGAEHPSVRFALARGWRLGQLAVTRELALPTPDLQALADEAAAHHEGYRLVTATDGHYPDDLFAGYVDLMNLVAVEAPTDDLEIEASRQTPQGYRRVLATERSGGRHRAMTIAVAPDGTVAAATSMAASSGDHLDQYGTIVAREHRGHRLGLAVKVANLVAAQRIFPGKARVVTTNAETNAHMVAVNERLGFRAVGAVADLQRRLV